MGNLSGESREENRKDKVTRFPSVTYARQLVKLENTLRRHFKRVSMGLTDRRKTAKNLIDSRKN